MNDLSIRFFTGGVLLTGDGLTLMRAKRIALDHLLPGRSSRYQPPGVTSMRKYSLKSAIDSLTASEGDTTRNAHVALRNDNAHRERRFYGASADREIVKEPVYDVKALDRLVGGVAREIRLLDQALKATTAKTFVEGYDQNDAVLGELT